MMRTVGRVWALLLSFVFAACVVASPPDGTGTAGANCTSHEACPAPLLCLSGRCAESAGACASGLSCAENDACPSGACEGGCCASACQSDLDCDRDSECRAGRCREQGAPCLDDLDCSRNTSTPRCVADTGTCVRCVEDADCGQGSTCTGHRCLTPPAPAGCRTDADCASTPLFSRCLADEGRCVACVFDAQCNTGPVYARCDSDSHACVREDRGCGSDLECRESDPTRPRCRSDRRCVGCLTDRDCPNAGRCLRNQTCTTEPRCLSDRDCGGDRSRCQATDALCVECTTSSQCGAGRFCQSNRCIPTVRGCLDDAMCDPEFRFCDTSARTCVRCRTDDDCDGAFCDGEGCLPCRTDAECRDRRNGTLFCAIGKCTRCITDTDCPSGRMCLSRACVVDPLDGACPADGQCGAERSCVREADGVSRCRLTCTPWIPQSECAPDQACRLLSLSTAGASGVCEPVAGRRADGQACADDAQCSAGSVCVTESATSGSVCRPGCDARAGATATCPSGLRCAPIARTDSSGRQIRVGACTASARWHTTCARATDCDSGQSCALGPDPSDPRRAATVCRAASGTLPDGSPCDRNVECATGACVIGAARNSTRSGTCLRSCASAADCNSSSTCATTSVVWSQDGTTLPAIPVRACVPTCQTDADCRSGQACRVSSDPSGRVWVRFCAEKQGSVVAGGRCQRDTDCAAGRCQRWGANPTGRCLGPCVAATDCAGGTTCPPEGVRLAVGPGTDGIVGNSDDAWAVAPVCRGAGCTRDADCGSGQSCGADPAASNPEDLDVSCRPTQGGVRGGDTCTADADCRSGWCIRWGTGKRCFGACRDAADCAAGSSCREVRLSSQATRTVSTCVP